MPSHFRKEHDKKCGQGSIYDAVYTTLNDSIAACRNDDQCKGIQDTTCDEGTEFWKCKALTFDVANGKCIYKKMQGKK